MDQRQAEVLRRVLESDRIDLHTALPGVIRSYDAATQTADIALGVKRILPSGDDDDPDETEDYPILPSVPVLWPRAHALGYFLHMPLRPGDGVLVLFSESDLSQWRATGQAGEDPGVSTRHGLSGAVAIPGMHWQGNPLASADTGGEVPAIRIGKEGGTQVKISNGAVEAGGSEALALASPAGAIFDAIVTDLQTLAAAINLIASGAVTVPTSAQAVATANPLETSVLRGS